MSKTTNPIEAITAHHSSPGEQYFPVFKVNAALTKEAERLVALYPEGKEQSAVLPIIHLVQGKFGYISAAAMEWIAEMSKSSRVHVAGVVSFYPGIHQKCPGKFHIRVCRTIACALNGGDELFTYICKTTGINQSDITDDEAVAISPDGLWSIEAVECLANCGFGPNLMVNEKLYSQVSFEKVDEIVAEYSI